MMSSPMTVGVRVCQNSLCNRDFTPHDRGYNARYCSSFCKRQNQRARMKATSPEAIRVRRARSYRHTKSHPDRLDKHRATGRNYRCAVREWLSAYKMERGCVDCGYKVHPAALQLDHEGTKSVEIADARSSIRRLKAEIEAGQCKVRCANCHSIRTWERKQKQKHIASENCDVLATEANGPVRKMSLASGR